MGKDRAIRGSDIVGVGRLAVDAMFGLTDVVEAMHGTIVRRPLPFGRLADTRTRGITRLVYQSIRAVTAVVGGGIHAARMLATSPIEETSGPQRDAVLSVLNGVIGDHLAATQNELAIPMAFRSQGEMIAPDRETIASRMPAATGRLLVLVHGLCMSDLQWKRHGHDHGEALSAAHGWTRVYVRYNSGRHISLNGRELAEQLEALVAAWPVPITDLVLLGHSMGGLVSRSACHYASLANHRWLEPLSRMVFLGSPHHGAPLERVGNLANLLLEVSPYAAPLSRIGGNRSAGINDLRFGNIVDEDWSAQARNHRRDARSPVPLPSGVECFAIAATKGRVLGDGLVPVASALGEHPDPRFALAFPPANQRVVPECGHMDLLDSPVVAEQLAIWLA